MLRRWPIALAQIEAGNISENLLNDLRQIVHYLHQAKEITKKVYNKYITFVSISIYPPKVTKHKHIQWCPEDIYLVLSGEN